MCWILCIQERDKNYLNKTEILHKLNYRFNTIPNNANRDHFIEVSKPILKYLRKSNGSLIAKVLQKEDKERKIFILSDMCVLYTCIH